MVTSAQNLVDDPQLQARGYFAWAKGVHRDLVMYPRPAFILSGQRQGVRWPAPMPGEHNELILQQQPGLTEAAIRELEETGVIGREPILAADQ